MKTYKPIKLLFLAIIFATFFAFFLPQNVSAQAPILGPVKTKTGDICFLRFPADGTENKIFGGVIKVLTKPLLASAIDAAKGLLDLFKKMTDKDYVAAKQAEIKKGLCVGDLYPEKAGVNYWLLLKGGGNLFIGVGIVKMLLWGAFEIAAYSSYILSFVMYNIVGNPITTDVAYIPAWVQLKNLGNMVIVLGFIVAGVATALRIGDYGAKKLLPKLILAALLINFSGVMCGLVIDASNLVTTGLIGGSTASGNIDTKDTLYDKNGDQITKLDGPAMAEYLLYKVHLISYGTLDDPLQDKDVARYLGLAVAYAVIYLYLSFSFLLLAFVMISRYAILILLFIVSPLAIVAFVFPASAHLFKQWWTEFFKWAFTGVILSFVLYLMLPLIAQINKNPDPIGTIIAVVVVLTFLTVGINFTIKNNGFASAVTGALMGVAGAALSAATYGAVKLGGAGLKSLDDATGNKASGWLQERKLAAAQTLERMHLGGSPGTAIGQQGKRIEDQATLFQSQYDRNDPAEQQRIQRLARGNGIEAMAARSVLANEGQLHTIYGDLNDPANRDRAIDALRADQRMGAKSAERKAIEKDYRLAGYGLGHTAATTAANNTARENQFIVNLQDMPRRQKESLPTAMFTPRVGQRMDESTIKSFQTINNGAIRAAVQTAVRAAPPPAAGNPQAVEAYNKRQAAADIL